MKIPVFALTLLFVLSLTSSCFYDNQEDLYDYQVVADTTSVPCEFTTVSFANDVLPVLSLQCNGACHNANDRLGNIVLETHNNVLPYVNDGSLIGSIIHTGGFSVMPPGGQKIPSCDINKLQSWIDSGAPNN